MRAGTFNLHKSTHAFTPDDDDLDLDMLDPDNLELSIMNMKLSKQVQ